MTIVILIFVIGYLAGRLAEARRYNRLALPAPAPVALLPETEPESVTAAPVAIVDAPVIADTSDVEKSTTPTQNTVEPAETAPVEQIPTTDKETVKARREAEKAAIAQQKRDQAAIDLDHYTMQRDRLMELSDTVENELTGNITDKRRAALLRQRITLEERLYQTEKRMNKAYFILNLA